MIRCAAILHDGVIHVGPAHSTIGTQMVAKGACKPPFPGGEAQGFVTGDGTFVSRKDALRIAIACGQVVEDKVIMPQVGLDSGDLRRTKDLTTRDGLLWLGDKMVGLPMADWLAQAWGFQYAEQLVRWIEKNGMRIPNW